MKKPLTILAVTWTDGTRCECEPRTTDALLRVQITGGDPVEFLATQQELYELSAMLSTAARKIAPRPPYMV